MSDQFQRAMRGFVVEKVKLDLQVDDVVVTDIKFIWREGHHYSSWTVEDPSFHIDVTYAAGGGPEQHLWLYDEDAMSMGDLLRDLLSWERPDTP